MKISLINKKRKSSQLFLAVFLGFLTLSFSHSHSFNYSLSSSEELSTEQSDHIFDPLLDTDFSCTIFAFYNSFIFQNVHQESDQLLTISSLFIELYQNFNSIKFYNSNNLRAPPEILV